MWQTCLSATAAEQQTPVTSFGCPQINMTYFCGAPNVKRPRSEAACFAVQIIMAIRLHPMATMLEAPGCGWAATTARPVRLQLPAASEVMAAAPMPRLQLVSSLALHAEHPCWH